jgi:glycerol-3-phosphate dehydrogenase
MLQLVAEDPQLGKPLTGAPEYLRVEMLYGVSHEGALHLDDLLACRTRISIETFDRGLSAAPEVARIVGPVLGWTEDDIARKSSTTPPASRPSGNHRNSPMITPPTQRALAPPM